MDESDVWDESLIDEVLIYDKITKKWLNSAFDYINDHSQKNSSPNIEIIRNYLKARYTDNLGGE